MEAAIKLFPIKVLPYGLQLIWEHLNTSCLRKLEKVKATYLIKASGLSKHALSRTVYELTTEDRPTINTELRSHAERTTKEESSKLARLLLYRGDDHRGLEADEL